MVKFGSLSIQKKLIYSLTAGLVVTIGLSSAVAVWMIGSKMQDRVETQELPANVTAIRNDVLRTITGPFAQSMAMAENPFLLKWESAGLSDERLPDWEQYAQRLKATAKASSVYWVSAATGKYLTEKGVDRVLSRQAASDQWFYGFVDSGKKFSLDFDVDKSTNIPSLFINVRFDSDGKVGVAGLGLEVASLAETIGQYRIADTGHVYLVRPDGTILLHGDRQLVSGRTKVASLPGWSEQALSPLLAQKNYASVLYNGPSGSTLAASSYIPELNLYVFAEVPEREVIGPVRNTLLVVTILTGLGSVLVSALLVAVISRAIAGPVQRASRLLAEIADGDGDLTRKLNVETQDETGELASNFNRFVGSLASMVGMIRQSTDMINTASSEVAVGNQDLSSRTEQAASALQETAAAMAQITDSVRHSASTATEASSLAQGAVESARDSGQAMQEVVSTMAEISSSSHKIRDIIGVIDGIAFQTNILALNAAVEAARAGEQGRGFAVVASEVRALAQRSGGAAKEIRSLITSSVDMVEAGSGHVQKAGDAIQGLIDA
ncbi:MAG TPA: methyl-accepting chemotaxis protein, partial [Aquabacterium sp.]|nr:methyl-accepting chemotaxis protein [Aquabacterium sp.]